MEYKVLVLVAGQAFIEDDRLGALGMPRTLLSSQVHHLDGPKENVSGRDQDLFLSTRHIVMLNTYNHLGCTGTFRH
jgi:hypothetical protein